MHISDCSSDVCSSDLCVFIDADKQNNARYVEEAIRLGRPGTTIIVDNVVREGGVLDADSDDERIIGTRALFDMLSGDPRLDATAVQTVGAKKWDGFRSEEHTSELQSLMRTSYAVF